MNASHFVIFEQNIVTHRHSTCYRNAVCNKVNHVNSVASDSSSVSFTMSILLLLLHLIVISFSKFASLNLNLSGLKVFPSTLNSLSTGADVAELYRNLDANFDYTGKRSEQTFQ